MRPSPEAEEETKNRNHTGETPRTIRTAFEADSNAIRIGYESDSFRSPASGETNTQTNPIHMGVRMPFVFSPKRTDKPIRNECHSFRVPMNAKTQGKRTRFVCHTFGHSFSAQNERANESETNAIRFGPASAAITEAKTNAIRLGKQIRFVSTADKHPNESDANGKRILKRMPFVSSICKHRKHKANESSSFALGLAIRFQPKTNSQTNPKRMPFVSDDRLPPKQMPKRMQFVLVFVSMQNEIDTIRIRFDKRIAFV